MVDRVAIYRDNVTSNIGTCNRCHEKDVERLYLTLYTRIIGNVCIECFKVMMPNTEAKSHLVDLINDASTEGVALNNSITICERHVANTEGLREEIPTLMDDLKEARQKVGDALDFLSSATRSVLYKMPGIMLEMAKEE